jgi:hypothetical protein
MSARKVTEADIEKVRRTEVRSAPVYQWWEVDGDTASSLDLDDEWQGEKVLQITFAGTPLRYFVQTIGRVWSGEKK